MDSKSDQDRLNVLVTGASGFIGSHITPALTNAGYRVTACVRNPKGFQLRFPGIHAIYGDATKDLQASDWLPRLKVVDVVVNAIGIIREIVSQFFDAVHRDGPMALFDACEKAGIQKVIQLSALGADDSAFSRYHRSKREADKYLTGLKTDWVILQPSIVYGPGGESTAFFKALAALPLIPLIDTGEQQLQPIHIDDLTRAIVQTIESNNLNRLIIEIVGPTPITVKELLSELRSWLGFGKARFVSIPYSLSLFVGRLGKLFQASLVTPETIRMLRQGSTGEVSSFIDRFGFKPKSLGDALIESPSQQSDRWHARLYSLKPMLRLSIAFLWIYTGIVSAFIYPKPSSFALLARVGIPNAVAPLALYGAAALDFCLGLATLFRYRLTIVGLIQIALILIYTLLISVGIPELWTHPFGPISKNVPLLVATLIMIFMEEN
jgi:nucleoside-diphosphate-sugar epimerase